VSPEEAGRREQEARRLARETPLPLTQARTLVAEHGSAEAAARWAGHALATPPPVVLDADVPIVARESIGLAPLPAPVAVRVNMGGR
jgi:hypothetical protein